MLYMIMVCFTYCSWMWDHLIDIWLFIGDPAGEKLHMSVYALICNVWSFQVHFGCGKFPMITQAICLTLTASINILPGKCEILVHHILYKCLILYISTIFYHDSAVEHWLDQMSFTCLIAGHLRSLIIEVSNNIGFLRIWHAKISESSNGSDLSQTERSPLFILKCLLLEGFCVVHWVRRGIVTSETRSYGMDENKQQPTWFHFYSSLGLFFTLQKKTNQ